MSGVSGELTYLCLVFHKGDMANSVDTDQMPQIAPSDQGQLCLHLGQDFL